MLCIGFVFSLVGGRLVQLQAMEGPSLSTHAEAFRLNTVTVPAVRGSISTADGTTLAMTMQTDLVHADPPMIIEAKRSLSSVASALAGPLGMTPAAILALLQNPTSLDYVALKRSVPAATAARIAALNLPGVALTPSYTRVYPNGGLAANIVGFTTSNVKGDPVGQAGIEQSYNGLLAGRDGSQEVQNSSNGQPIPVAGQTSRSVVPGRNVRLTVLASLQWQAEQACAQRVKETNASNCTVVVMDPRTGQILAMAQAPSFNPAHPDNLANTADLPVSDVFDPGSTAKVITAAAAFEHGGQTPMSGYTVPDQIVVDGFPFHDAEYHPTERWTIAGIIAHSSNVGMVQVVQHVSPQTQYDYFRNFGIGQPSLPQMPADSNGLLSPTSQWSGDTRYTMAFGQGVAVTAVQMASVYATIANGGIRVTPTIVAGTNNTSGQYVPGPEARPAPGHPGQDRAPADGHPAASAVGGRPGRRAVGGDTRLLGGGQDRHRADRRPGQGRLPLPVRVERHRRRAGQQPTASRRGQRAEPAQGQLLRHRGGGAGVQQGDGVRAAHPEDPAGRGPASPREAHGAVIRGNLGACLRLCFHATFRRVRCPGWPCCSG